MEIAPETSDATYVIRAYDEHSITVNDQVLRESFIITNTRLIHPWRPSILKDLHQKDWALVLAWQPQVVLIGSGMRTQTVSPILLTPLTAIHIGIEVMSTPAACRTYNILTTEGRKVAAAFFFQ